MSLQIRTLHAYIGMLIAPAVIFFAATGLLQIYSLHEAHTGYTPPAILERLGSVHKDQNLGRGHREPPGDGHLRPAGPAPEIQHPDEGSHGDADHDDHNANVATGLLKAFFAAVAVGLILSTILGVWMAFQQRMRRRAHLILLLIGTLVPVILAALTT